MMKRLLGVVAAALFALVASAGLALADQPDDTGHDRACQNPAGEEGRNWHCDPDQAASTVDDNDDLDDDGDGRCGVRCQLRGRVAEEMREAERDVDYVHRRVDDVAGDDDGGGRPVDTVTGEARRIGGIATAEAGRVVGTATAEADRITADDEARRIAGELSRDGDGNGRPDRVDLLVEYAPDQAERAILIACVEAGTYSRCRAALDEVRGATADPTSVTR